MRNSEQAYIAYVIVTLSFPNLDRESDLDCPLDPLLEEKKV